MKFICNEILLHKMITWPGGSFKINRAAFTNVPLVKMEDALAGAEGITVSFDASGEALIFLMLWRTKADNYA